MDGATLARRSTTTEQLNGFSMYTSPRRRSHNLARKLRNQVGYWPIRGVYTFLGTEAVTQDWPPLPKQGFISGRVATPADVAAGNAVFSATVGGGAVGKSTPLRIQIPQYAYYKEGGTKIPVIVLQAERIDIQKQGGELVQMPSVAALKPDGTKFIGILTSFELLGRVRPR